MARSLEERVDLADPIILGGVGIGSSFGGTYGSLYGSSLSSYVGGSSFGISNATLVSGMAGGLIGGVLGYVSFNLAYKLARDTARNTYNFLSQPIITTRKLFSGFMNLLKKPYRLLTEPFKYAIRPAIKRKAWVS